MSPRILATITLCICLAPAACLLSRSMQESVTQYGLDKAARLAECQAQELSKEQAAACLGEFAANVGTEACGEAQRWLDTLPPPEQD